MATARKTPPKPAVSAEPETVADVVVDVAPALPVAAPAPVESPVVHDLKDSFETSLKAATQGVTALHVKTVEALQASADVQFAFIKALFVTKSISDLIVLQGELARQQFETLNAAAKDMSNLLQKVSTETVEPIKTAITKSLKSAA